MTLQEALAALTNRFPADAWSAELVVTTEKNGQRVVEPLAAIGFIPTGDTFMASLITESELNRIKQQTGRLPVLGEISKA